ncbi:MULTISPECIES: DUF2069 domain-containing protein [unclassified Achromobacter]|uniref:DUF2069 domain-containing protein n=1 Tax=unclassified Achromobacter TaxID=2626865 RepID=UPI000B515F94|nr:MULTISPECIES: DUF2069 domain-containing protein [unclassified Achromobacter]OWT77184.1 hypothetical protein CEY04_14505 [Achromobacter sp. HZ28]OWT78065.1 hypothetical protein CEY05_09000 [Achromobacter sp. HZ34]
MNGQTNSWLRGVATITLVALLVLCVLWEGVLAPLRPGGSWLILKALPLALPLGGIVRGDLYTYQWASMLSLLYIMEGAVRVMSDLAPVSAALAGLELALALVFFVSAIMYVWPAKRAARRRKLATRA